jgi:hypothetical protein
MLRSTRPVLKKKLQSNYLECAYVGPPLCTQEAVCVLFIQRLPLVVGEPVALVTGEVTERRYRPRIQVNTSGGDRRLEEGWYFREEIARDMRGLRGVDGRR